MSSAARRRRDRVARQRRFRQEQQKHERLEDELRCRWDTHIVRPEYVPANLRTVNAPQIGDS